MFLPNCLQFPQPKAQSHWHYRGVHILKSCWCDSSKMFMFSLCLMVEKVLSVTFLVCVPYCCTVLQHHSVSGPYHLQFCLYTGLSTLKIFNFLALYKKSVVLTNTLILRKNQGWIDCILQASTNKTCLQFLSLSKHKQTTVQQPR